MITQQDIEALLATNLVEFKKAMNTGNLRRAMELKTQRDNLKDCLIELLKKEAILTQKAG